MQLVLVALLVGVVFFLAYVFRYFSALYRNHAIQLEGSHLFAARVVILKQEAVINRAAQKNEKITKEQKETTSSFPFSYMRANHLFIWVALSSFDESSGCGDATLEANLFLFFMGLGRIFGDFGEKDSPLFSFFSLLSIGINTLCEHKSACIGHTPGRMMEN